MKQYKRVRRDERESRNCECLAIRVASARGRSMCGIAACLHGHSQVKSNHPHTQPGPQHLLKGVIPCGPRYLTTIRTRTMTAHDAAPPTRSPLILPRSQRDILWPSTRGSRSATAAGESLATRTCPLWCRGRQWRPPNAAVSAGVVAVPAA